jgi:hypothetical protein
MTYNLCRSALENSSDQSSSYLPITNEKCNILLDLFPIYLSE